MFDISTHKREGYDVSTPEQTLSTPESILKNKQRVKTVQSQRVKSVQQRREVATPAQTSKQASAPAPNPSTREVATAIKNLGNTNSKKQEERIYDMMYKIAIDDIDVSGLRKGIEHNLKILKILTDD